MFLQQLESIYFCIFKSQCEILFKIHNLQFTTEVIHLFWLVNNPVSAVAPVIASLWDIL